LQAVEVVREMNCFDKRTLPEKVPTGFIRRVWRPLVLRKGAVDRQAYEICMLCELRDRLRAGEPRAGRRLASRWLRLTGRRHPARLHHPPAAALRSRRGSSARNAVGF
jgi:hypothetical protein